MALQASAASMVVGSLVWLEDPDEAWIDGEVVEINKEDIKVLCTSGQTVSAFIETPQCPCLLCQNLNFDSLSTAKMITHYFHSLPSLVCSCHQVLRFIASNLITYIIFYYISENA